MPDETTHAHDGNREERITALLATALERLEDEGPAGVEALCGEHPDVADELRRRVAELHGAGLLDSPDDEDALVSADDLLPERIGEFRPIARLGGGGMGVVYLARQESLRRLVALKLVHPDHLVFPAVRERFRREAEAVARLSHPGIVPVYSVGEERGTPFIAMEHVHGATLGDVIEALEHDGRDPASLAGDDLRVTVASIVEVHGHAAMDPDAATRGARTPGAESAGDRAMFRGSWPDAVVRCVLQAAVALQHAHARGVLHRDLKPSNLMLTAAGRVQLFDFGLASAVGSERITRTGLLLGSLAYMSPEQLDGEAGDLDARTDVYALGVTLYELLTLRLPFGGRHTTQVAAAIRAAEPPSPRRLNPAVSRDLETVCLAALEKDPERRYPTAAAFAQDLRNVLERRPVSVRPAGAWLRARRFAQRRPAATTALVLAFLLVVGGPVAYAVQQSRAQAKLKLAYDDTVRERDRAQANLRHAVAAVDAMLTRVGDETLAVVPEAEPVRRALLQDAVGFFERFVAENPGDVAVASSAAAAGVKLGGLHLSLGEIPAARAAMDEAVALAQRAADARPGDAAALALLGHAWMEREAVARLESDAAARERALLAGQDALARAIALAPDDPATMAERAGGLERWSAWQLETRRPAEAEASLREALALQTAAVARAPDVTRRRQLAAINNNLGDYMRTIGRHEDAEPWYRKAVELGQALVDEQPDVAGLSAELSAGQSNLASLLMRQRRFDEAQALFDAAIERCERMARLHPLDHHVRHFLVFMLGNSGSMYVIQGRMDEARARLLRAVEVAEELARTAPDSPDSYRSLGSVLGTLSSVSHEAGRTDEALALSYRARDAADRGLLLQPGDPLHLQNTADVRLSIIRLQHRAGAHDKAAMEVDAMLALPRERLPPTLLRRLAQVCARIGREVRAGATVASDTSPTSGEPIPGLDALPADEREALAAAWEARALAIFERAVDEGLSVLKDLDTSPDWEELRFTPEWQALRARIPDKTQQ